MKNYLLILPLLCVEIFASAQPTQQRYGENNGDYQRRASQEREAAFNNQWDSRTPNKPASKSSGYAETIDEKRAKAARDADYKKQHELEMEAEQRRYKLVNDDYKRRQDSAMRVAKAATLRAVGEKAVSNAKWEPIRQQYKSYTFFTDNDRDVLAKLTLSDGGALRADGASVKFYPTYYQNYLGIAKTGSYEEVLSSILKFDKLTNKAEDALEALAARFPTHQSDLDNLMVKVWRKSLPQTKLDDPGSLQRLAKRLPYPTLNSMSNWQKVTLKNRQDIEAARKNPGFDKSALIAMEKEYFDIIGAEFIPNSWSVFTEYLASQSPQELLALSRKKGITPSYLLEYGCDIKAYVWRRMGIRFESHFNKHKEKHWEKHLPPVDAWRLFAEAGDADAMDFYACAISYRYTRGTKTEAAEWHKKAEQARAKEKATDGYYVFDFAYYKN